MIEKRKLRPRYVAKGPLSFEDRNRVVRLGTSIKLVARALGCSEETVRQLKSPCGACTPETLERVRMRLAELGV